MEPHKPDWVQRIREVIDTIPTALPLPNINPHLYSALKVVFTGIGVWMYPNALATASFILLGILCDWLDGVTARKHNRVSPNGWAIDVGTDRLSELVVVVFFPMHWLIGIFVLNLMFTYAAVKKWTYLSIPLRAIFMVWVLL